MLLLDLPKHTHAILLLTTCDEKLESTEPRQTAFCEKW